MIDAPVIISAAITGGFQPPDPPHPHLPLTAEEIGRQAVECWRAGAAVVHLHARDDEGAPAWQPEYFERALAVIHDAGSDVVVNLTTSWGGTDLATKDEQRFAPLALQPNLGSFDCGTLNFNQRVFHNSPTFLRQLATEFKTAGVKPEIEIFDAGMIGTALRLSDEGLLEEPLFFQFVLGIAGGAPATPASLVHLVSLLPPGSIWSVCAAGRSQLPMNMLGLVLGGHLRTGLEDNFWFAKGQPAENAQLVARLSDLVKLADKRVASPDDAREILQLRGAQ